MKHLLRVSLLMTAAIALLSSDVYAQSRDDSGAKGAPVQQDADKKPQKDKKRGRKAETPQTERQATAEPAAAATESTGKPATSVAVQNGQAEEDDFVMPENPQHLSEKERRMYYLRKVNIHGVKYLNHDILRSASGLVPGDSIYLPSSFIQNAINRLWSQRYFSDIQIGANIDGDSVDLEVMLKERPRVVNWAITGVSKGKSKDLLEELKLKRGHELSDYIVDKNSKLIKQHFGNKGFRNCDVDVKIEQDTVIPQGVNVTFDVKKNARVRVGEITFSGNDNFKDKRLRRTFKKTHKTSIMFWQNTKFNETDFDADKELLIDFYNSKGYRNANVVSDSVYAINDKRLGIHINLEEGNKYYIRNVTWVGNSRFDTQDLQRMFAVNKGDVYDKKSMHKRLGVGKEQNPDDMSVSSLYQNDGYLMSQIDPAEIIVGKDSLGPRNQDFRGQAVHNQQCRNHGQQPCGRRGDSPRTLYPSGRTLQPRAADADHPYSRRNAALQRGGYHAGHQTGVERTRGHQLASRREGVRPVQHRRRLGFGNVRGFGRNHAQQPFYPQFLQEECVATLPDGSEPASVDFGTDQRYVL